jgi:uncharacterized membrane protein
MFLRLFAIFMSVILGVLGQLSLKQGMLKVGSFPRHLNEIYFFYLKALLNPYIWLGFISYGLSFLIWLGILSKIELSYARPMVASGYILVALFSWWLWGENLNLQRWMGIILITVGVILVART